MDITYRVPIGGEWHVITFKEIERLPNEERKEWRDRIKEYQENPLKFFLPHGLAWSKEPRELKPGLMAPDSDYPQEWKNDGVAFLNDYESDISLIVGQNQGGKTMLLMAWAALRILPCECPDWPIFKENGVLMPEWHGPKRWILASYCWDSVQTLFERVLEVFPKKEIAQLTANPPRFGDGKPKRRKLTCGSELIFLCYDQKQQHWEGFQSDGASCDEQAPKPKWIGWRRSTITRPHHCQCGMALTGHSMEDRPDTGTTGWIYTDLWRGRNSMGLKIRRLQLTVASTPDAIVSPAMKERLWKQWVDPSIRRNPKEEAEAEARYWGGWEHGAGSVVPQFDRTIHGIERLWPDNQIPEDWLNQRILDYGTKQGVNCCLWVAMSPPSFRYKGVSFRKSVFVVHRCLYERGYEIADTAREMITRSHNIQRETGEMADPATHATYKCFQEIQRGERIFRTIMDRRSASSPMLGMTIADWFARYGVECVAADAGRIQSHLALLQPLLAIDPQAPHLTKRDEKGDPVMGAPQLYFVNEDGICAPAIEELESLAHSQFDPDKIAPHQEDHAFSCLCYFAAANPIYDAQFTGDWISEPDKEIIPKPTPYTGA